MKATEKIKPRRVVLNFISFLFVFIFITVKEKNKNRICKKKKEKNILKGVFFAIFVQKSLLF